MLNQQPLEVLFLDFDGVIVESNRIKDQGFETIFARYPDHYDTLIALHRSSDHASRHEKFEEAARVVLEAENWQDVSKSMVAEYSRTTTGLVARCPYVDGALELLASLQGQVPVVLLSATHEPDLLEVVAARGIRDYFDEVHGSPIDKAERMLGILEERGIVAEHALFVGDSPDDVRSAVRSGVPFAGRQSDKVLPPTVSPVFEDLTGILHYILHARNVQGNSE